MEFKVGDHVYLRVSLMKGVSHFWYQREASPSLRLFVSHPREVWTSGIPSGTTSKPIRFSQRIPRIPTQKVSKASNWCGD
jgi:hypothetical protein